MDRLLQLLPEEPRALKQLDDIVDSDFDSDLDVGDADDTLIGDALRIPAAGKPIPLREVPASSVRSRHARLPKRSAAS